MAPTRESHAHSSRAHLDVVHVLRTVHWVVAPPHVLRRQAIHFVRTFGVFSHHARKPTAPTTCMVQKMRGNSLGDRETNQRALLCMANANSIKTKLTLRDGSTHTRSGIECNCDVVGSNLGEGSGDELSAAKALWSGNMPGRW